MKRISITPRGDWQDHASSIGFNWHTRVGSPSTRTYWDESAYYSLTPADADTLYQSSRDVYDMMMSTIDEVIEMRQLPLFGYSPDQIALIEKSWRERDEFPSFYGRFNVVLTPDGPKFLSFNGDNPTGLFEASIFQRQWLDATYEGTEQFNVIHDRIADLFKMMAGSANTTVRMDGESRNTTLHVTCITPDAVQQGTADYLLNVASEAGVEVVFVPLTDIGLIVDGDEVFVDGENRRIDNLLKLCPLNWMLKDQFGPDLIRLGLRGDLNLIEPAWKMLASNNRLFAAMWSKYAYHPLLVHTATSIQPEWSGAVSKPINGRDGQNITVRDGDVVLDQTKGGYGDDELIYQERVVLSPNNTVVHSWIVGGDAVGLSFRESDSKIIDNETGRLVPHAIDG